MDITRADFGGPLLISGASGFIGANLCRYFTKKKLQVVALVRSGEDNWRLKEISNLRVVEGDISSPISSKEVISQIQPAIFINCAAYGAYSSQNDSNRIYEVNFGGLRHLLENLRGVPNFRAFIQAGTSSEYGRNCASPTEEQMTIPDSHYAVSKVAATSLVQYLGQTLGFPAWVLRLYSVYGPYEEISRLMPQLLLAAKESKLPPLVSPNISRDFVHSDDVCRAFEKICLLSRDLPRGEVFNIGSGEMTRLEDLVELARELFKIKAEPQWGSQPNRAWDHSNWHACAKKANQMLDWKADISLREGLQTFMNWLTQNPEMIDLASVNSILKRSK